MNKIRILMIALTAILLVGCAGSLEPYSYKISPITKDIAEKNYIIGEKRQAYIGDVVVRAKNYQQTIQKTNELEALTSFMIVSNNVAHFSIGQKFKINGYYDIDGVKYLAIRTNNYKPYLLVKDNILHNQAIDLQFPILFKIEISPKTVEFKESLKITNTASPSNSNYEILYSGSDDKSFYLSYREYTIDDIVRPAFSQSMTYLKGQNTIRFKNLIIQVDSIDNEKIVYKVLQD
jgi:hypothetical protein